MHAIVMITMNAAAPSRKFIFFSYAYIDDTQRYMLIIESDVHGLGNP